MLTTKKLMQIAEEINDHMLLRSEWPGRLVALKQHDNTKLRILEFTDENGNQLFARPMILHLCADKGRRFQICTREMFKESCNCCDINGLAKTFGDREPFTRHVRYIVNAVDLYYEYKSVELFVIPPIVFRKLADLALSKSWAHIFEVKDGRAVSIGRYGDGLNTRYRVKVLSKRHPIDTDMVERVVDPLFEIRNLSFECDGSKPYCNECCKYPAVEDWNVIRHGS